MTNNLNALRLLDSTDCPACLLPLDDHVRYADKRAEWLGCAAAEQVIEQKLDDLYAEDVRRKAVTA